MSSLQVYISNASKMLVASSLPEPHKAFVGELYDVLAYSKRVNLFQWLTCLITDFRLLGLSNSTANGLKILKRNIDRPTPAAKLAMKIFLRSNWIKVSETEFGSKSAVPALYWAAFANYGFVPYKD